MLFHRFEGLESLAELLAGDDLDALRHLDGKPALIHLQGEVPGPHRLVSVLLHGNEDSGFRGLLSWLRERPQTRNPLWVFIGNTRAASQNGWFADRYLDDQEDFNRVWGIHPVSNRMRRCAAEVLEIVQAEPLEAAIDVHNNTGDNPLYAILPTTTAETYALAGIVSSVGLLWATQTGTLMQALEPSCPAVAIECGMAGVAEHADLAREVIERFVAAPAITAGLPRPADLFQVLYRVEVRPEVAFTFADVLDDEAFDLAIRTGLDKDNFGMLLAGTPLAAILPGSEQPFVVVGDDGEDVTDRFLEVTADGTILTREDLIPAMMTRTPTQTRRDCLFYIVRRRT